MSSKKFSMLGRMIMSLIESPVSPEARGKAINITSGTKTDVVLSLRL
ncbi:hypothetical protein WIW89_10050 [Stygiolobus sp. CP850M]|jgi:hypothetical protein